MAKHTAALLGLLLLCAGGAAWVALGSPASPPGPAPATPTGTTASPSPAARLEGSAAIRATATAADLERGTANGDERRQVTAPTGPTDGTLLVVDAESQEPLAGAEVFFSAERVHRDHRAPRQHWAQMLEDAVPALRTDAAGRVEVPSFDRTLWIAGRADDRFGFLRLSKRTESPVLELYPDHTVHVLVRDAGGEPRAGVPVVLCTDRLPQLDAKQTATTDTEGRAELRHVQIYGDQVVPEAAALQDDLKRAVARRRNLQEMLRQLRSGGGRGGSLPPPVENMRSLVEAERAQQARLQSAVKRLRQVSHQAPSRTGPNGRTVPANAVDADFVVVAGLPQTRPVQARFPADAVPTETLELRLAATGSVVVRLVGPANRVLLSPCEVELRTHPLDRSAGQPPDAAAKSLGRITMLSADKPLGDQQVRFDTVGVGVTLDVSVRFRDGDFNFGHTALPGPDAGEERVIECTVPGWFTVLTGRLIGSDGLPAGDLEPQLFVTGRAGRVEGEQVQLAADGRFELPIRLRRPAPPYALEVQAERGGTPIGTLVALPQLRQGARHELGDITIGELPVVAHGVVRDDRGEPIEDASVMLQALRRDSKGRDRWRDEAYVRARTGADGRYELRGSPRPVALRLAARARHHLSVEQATTFGDQRDLVLERSAELSGDGVVPSWLPHRALRLQLLLGGETVRDDALRVHKDGRFRFQIRELHSGSYELAIVLRGAVRPLLSVPGVVVEPGQHGPSPQVSDLDLTGRVFRYALTAVDQDGNAVHPSSPLLAMLPGTNGARHTVGFPWHGDKIEFYATDPTVEVIALAHHRLPQRTVLNPGDTRLVMHRTHPLVVRVPGLSALVGHGVKVLIRLQLTDNASLPLDDVEAIDQSRGRSRHYSGSRLGKSGGGWLHKDRAQVSLMLNGRYEVSALLLVSGSRENVSTTLGFVDAVLDGPRPMQVTVPGDPARIRAALAELRAKSQGR